MSKNQSKQSHWKLIKCPFFHGDDATSINCEGINRNTTLRQIFPNKESKKKWEKKYCESIHACMDCLVYKSANEKYK